MTPLGVGVVGCGNICGIYMSVFEARPELRLVCVTDLDAGRAEAAAAKGNCKVAGSLDELLADPLVDIVVVLTLPASHSEIALAAIAVGKHVYVEKPLALDLARGRAVLAAAERAGVSVGCAPDTVLGAGIQTCHSLIARGAIGRPVGGHAFMLCAGHESWHPDPAFYYQVGGGPLFDMGPYYLSALVWLLGPIVSVSATSSTPSPVRNITSSPRCGELIEVETPTSILATYTFRSGAVVGLTTSFDVVASRLPHFEIYGTDSTMAAPDPNGFDGPVSLWTGERWEDSPLIPLPSQNSRGLGVAEMAIAISEGRTCRASGQLGLHVLDAMESTLVAASTGKRIDLTTEPPALVPMPSP